jgi:hypothetical protein
MATLAMRFAIASRTSGSVNELPNSVAIIPGDISVTLT